MKNIVKTVSFLCLLIGLTACLKDDLITNQKYGMINLNNARVVEIPNGNDSIPRSVSLDLVNEELTLDFVSLHLASENPASDNIMVTLDTIGAQAFVDAYNLKHQTSLEVLPANLFTLPNGLNVTIPIALKDAILKLKVNPSLLDPSKLYALVFTISNLDKAGYVISGNFKKDFVTIAVKNPYDGIYDFKGYILRNSAGGPLFPQTGNFTGLENTLITLDANSVTFKQVWANNTGVGGIDGLKLSVDPATNNVTCSSTANATLVNEPTYNNHYDPATKTFYISFLWGTFPNNRAATDTLTFNRPRE